MKKVNFVAMLATILMTFSTGTTAVKAEEAKNETQAIRTGTSLESMDYLPDGVIDVFDLAVLKRQVINGEAKIAEAIRLQKYLLGCVDIDYAFSVLIYENEATVADTKALLEILSNEENKISYEIVDGEQVIVSAKGKGKIQQIYFKEGFSGAYENDDIVIFSGSEIKVFIGKDNKYHVAKNYLDRGSLSKNGSSERLVDKENK